MPENRRRDRAGKHEAIQPSRHSVVDFVVASPQNSTRCSKRPPGPFDLPLQPLSAAGVLATVLHSGQNGQSSINIDGR